MENEKVKLTEKEALTIIKQKLRNRKLQFKTENGYRFDIGDDNFFMSVSSSDRYGWGWQNRNFTSVDIEIRTSEYPHVYRRFRNFKVKTGDYAKVIEKIKFIIQSNIKIKEQKNTHSNIIKKNTDKLLKKLEGFKVNKSDYHEGMLEIKTEYFTMAFIVKENSIRVDIEENEITVEKAIELLDKLGMRK